MRFRHLPSLVALALLVSVLAGSTRAGAAEALPPTEWIIGPMQKVALITLDGTPGKPKHVGQLLASLKKEKAHASFFVPGVWVQHHPKRARAIRKAGHSLGNRGYGKKSFTELDDAALRKTILRARDVLNRTGAAPRPFLRAPGGERNFNVLSTAGSLGYRSVLWSHHPGGGLSKRVRNRVVRNADPGSIVSLDIWRRSHRKALPKIIRGLRDKGFKLRTLENLKNVHAIRWDVTVKSGSSGPDVRYLQKLLRHNTYPAGKPDRVFGYATLQGVYAFEKANGWTRDGVVTPAQMTAIAKAGRPEAPRSKGKRYVDIDISRQVLYEVRKGRVTRTLPISSGNEEYYTVDGETYKSHTPRGDFTIERKIPGWRVSRLGRLWYPSYFVGGFAVHGSESVPTYPASHGCVRIPMYTAKPFYDRNPVGVPVYVHD